jgi:2-keto-3-deoxy-L-rhamnonate aldolase RhmA
MNKLRAAVNANGGKPLLGIAVYFYDPPFVAMAAHLGFDVMWIEMEHTFLSFAEVADLCSMAKGAGMLTMIRVANAQRENVAKAAECGPDIIDVPMVSTAEHVRALIDSARFPPLGNRGFFSVSPSLSYGLDDNVAEDQKRINEELALMVQVETLEAVKNIETICAVAGVEIFIGPGDLSASCGVPGELQHPKVLQASRRIIEAAKKSGKLVAVGSGPAEFEFYTKEGVDLLFCGNDVACLRAGIRLAIQQGRAAIEKCRA